ncbi:MAG: hypothetical protein ACC663_12930 [Gammaproteobacteria bacterium]
MIFSILAIFVILYGLWLVVRLKKEMPGGIVGKRWNTLILLVLMFNIGFAFGPFFGSLPIETLRLLVSLIFFFGAIYVIITIRMIYSIIIELSQ